MRSRVIDKCFRQSIILTMRERLPDFTPQSPDKSNKGQLVFKYEGRNTRNSFVIFRFSDDNSDAFTVEFAWDPDPIWRPVDRLSVPVDISRSQIVADKPVDGRFRFRLAYLRPPHSDAWWTLTPEPTFDEIMGSLEDLAWFEHRPVDPLTPGQIRVMNELIDDAVFLIKQEALPLFFLHHCTFRNLNNSERLDRL